MVPYTRRIWRVQMVGVYAAALVLVVEHYLTCRWRTGVKALWPEGAAYFPIPVIAAMAIAGVLLALWAYPKLIWWLLGLSIVAFPAAWIHAITVSEWEGTGYDVTRHALSASFAFLCAVLAVRGYLYDQEFGREQLNVRDRDRLERPRQKYKPLRDPDEPE